MARLGNNYTPFKGYENINDIYGVKKDWDECMQLSEKITEEIDKFYSSNRIKKASVYARKDIMKMIKIMRNIRNNILRSRQDMKIDDL